MLIKKVFNEKFLKVIFVGLVSYYFGLIILQSNIKAVALLGLAVFIILFLSRIEYAFYFILASRTLADIFFSVEATEGVRMTHYIGGLLSVLFIYYIIVVSRYHIISLLSLDINKIYGIFLILSIPSIFFSEGLTTGLGYWFRLFQGFLVLNITILIILSAGNELSKKKINLICWSVIFAVFVPFLLYLKSYVLGEYVVGTGEYIRYATFGAHYNFFPHILVIIFPFCLFLFSVTIRNSKRIFWLIIIAVFIFTIYASYTRNAWLGLFTILLVWFILRKNFVLTYLLIIFSVLLIVFSSSVQDRLSDIYIVLSAESFFDIDPNLGSGRIGLLQQNISYFLNHSTLIEKLFGNGFQPRLGLTRGGIPSPEHNNYLVLLMNTGIFGLFFYLLYILKLFQESFKLLRRAKDIYFRYLAQVFIPILFSYLVISISDNMLWDISFQYYFSAFAGFVIAVNILEKNRDKEGNGIIIGEPKRSKF